MTGHEQDAGALKLVAPADDGTPSPCPAAGALRRRGYDAAKRTIDVVVASVALLVGLPLMLLLAVVIRLDSPGPALFRQPRVGRGGRTFSFWKFRTMQTDARDHYADLYRYDYSVDDLRSMFFKYADDPRLTRFGRRLRRTSLDELPNLVHVLTGRMTLVGPRPEIPEMVAHYGPDQLAKFSVKPGLTGLAQVSGRNILRFQETIGHDLEYVRRRSLWLDLRILLRTPVVVVRMIGAL